MSISPPSSQPNGASPEHLGPSLSTTGTTTEPNPSLAPHNSTTSPYDPRSLIILTGLKTLFQKQLPKMPREYIARLVFDENSRSLAIIKRGYKVVGGICFRPFPQRGFAEIVFFATNSADQEKGYGGMLMDHFKAHIRRTYPGMHHFLTYADNFAVGYFEKQGFTKEITLKKSIWAGYIKDYEGGTIMQCAMVPKVDYLDKKRIFAAQQEAILTKVREMSRSHVVHQGLDIFKEGTWEDGMTIDPKDVPGLRETGWNPEMEKDMLSLNLKSPDYNLMERTLSNLKGHGSSWPFREPVNLDEVPDYLEFIKSPMDLTTMEAKLESNQYKNLEQFVDDALLIFDNCRLYNPETTIFARNAQKMEKHLKDLLPSHVRRD
ncbi:histone acetyltransferase, GCN5 superfamily [Coprinellus micaceus]|uniref:histone acetyltransferase n=1 Tax=Coprinellus micaceus TaxID=71717 RepID=A0A4Y7T880_COPMI|nr:histone acetyltransferase, GCN5 superfamily [Coprinellus micaceus]